jgi:aminopeptidase YwaD
MPEIGLDNIRQHLENLVGERNPFTQPEHLERTSRYISNQFESMGLEVTREKVAYEGTESYNILGHKHSDMDAKELFVLAAHYDSVPDSPGADDNASAVAALLEIAHHLSETSLQNSLIFSAFTLEEYGFLGAKNFIDRDLERKNNISGMISLEMLGYKVIEPGSQSYPPYVDPLQYPAVSTGQCNTCVKSLSGCFKF